MYFCYLFAVVLVIHSASNGEIYQNDTDADFCPRNFTPSAYHYQSVPLPIRLAFNNEVYQNGTDINFTQRNFISSAYHLSVPLPTRIAVTSVLILLVFISLSLHVMVWRNVCEDVFLFIQYGISIGLLSEFLRETWEFDILSSIGCLMTVMATRYLSLRSMSTCRKVFLRLFVIIFKLLLVDVIILGVYKQIFSAFIPLAILVAMAIVGANLISNPFGLSIFNFATAYLMLVVNVKLLVTLNSALNEEKYIWPLTATLIKTVLMIFAIRSISITYVCRWARHQQFIDTHVSNLLPLTFQLSFNCFLGYLICLIYSFYTH